MKKYKLVRKEDGWNGKEGDIWYPKHTKESFCPEWTMTKLKNRWNSQWAYWYDYWGVPIIFDDSIIPGFRYPSFEEQTTFNVVEVETGC